MKTKILLFLSVLLINISVFGQWDHLFDSYTYDFNYNSKMEFVDPLTEMDEDLKFFLEHLKSARDFNDLWMLDSLVYYDFITEIDSFANERRIYTFDNANNMIEYISMHRSEPDQEWRGKTRNLLTYSDDNLNIESIVYKWYQGEWVKDKKQETIHNENNQLTQSVKFEWEEDQWVDGLKFVTIYNDNNLFIEQSTYNWIMEDSTWLNVWKTESGYNNEGDIILSISYHLPIGSNEMIRILKRETIYNEDGTENKRTEFRWDSNINVWYNYGRTTFSYESEISSFYNYYWDSTEWKVVSRGDELRIDFFTIHHNNYRLIDDTLWLHTYKSEKGFDELGNLISWESYGFNETANRWYGVTKSFSSLNEDGQYNWHISYYWDDGISEWYNPIKREIGYNEQKLLFYRSDSYWNIETNTWRKYDSQIYYYTNVSSINENRNEYSFINVYPNPCNKQLNLDFENLNNGKVDFKIYTILGKVVDEGILDPVDINSINVSHLENGFYMIQAISGKKKYSGKFIKF